MAEQVHFIVVDARDNVGTLLSAAAAGDTLVELGAADPTARRFIAPGDVPAGHKIALEEIPVGGPARKYGVVIGVATAPIRGGEWTHVHNLRSARGKGFTGEEPA